MRQPLTGARHTALANGARTVALHLLRSRASADLERQVESDLVVRLLEGTADAATVVSRLGLPTREMRVVAVRTHTSEEPHAMLLLAFEKATTGFGWSRPGRSALLGDTLYTLLPGAGAEAAREWVAALAAGLPPRVRVAAGIGAAAQAAERRRAAGRRRSAWRCTRGTPTAPSRLPTTSRGTTSCSSGCAPRPGRAASPRAGR